MAKMQKSPTFLVGAERQRGILEKFHRQEQHLSEEYQKNKPLCFSARAYQLTHPGKSQGGNHRDADATCVSPVFLGVCDGVSQIEDFGIDASELPNELLQVTEELAMSQLMPDGPVSPHDAYRGPVALLKEAYEETESLGSTTVLLAILDNSTVIHGKIHPMIAVLSIGDCQILLLRRLNGRQSELSPVFQTEMQRIDGHCQAPLQVARVDDRIDADFDEQIILDVIERGSAVHCVSAYEGDLVLMGSDGIFDNLFLEEIVEITNRCMPAQKRSGFCPQPADRLRQCAESIVQAAHAKTDADESGALKSTPIGRGGKMDDTSVIVGEVVEWTSAHQSMLEQSRRAQRWRAMTTCGGACRADNKSSPHEKWDGSVDADNEDEAMESDSEDGTGCSIV